MNRSIALAAVIALAGGIFLAAPPRAANAQTPPGVVVFDTITGLNTTPNAQGLTDLRAPSTTRNGQTQTDPGIPGTGGRSFLGQPFIPIASPQPNTAITGLDFFIASPTAQIFTNVVVNVQFYSAATNDAIGTVTPVFSSPAGGVQSFSLGPIIFNPSVPGGSVRAQSLTFATPISLVDFGSNPGLVINIQGDTGSGLTSSDALFAAVRGGTRADGVTPAPPFAVGSVPFNDPNDGYYRTSERNDFNFIGASARNSGVNSAVAVRLYAAVPEPGTFTLAAVGLLGLAPVLRRRRRKF